MTVTTATRLARLPEPDLVALHDRLNSGDPSDPAQVQAHHLVTTEMLSRGLQHGHDGDLWGRSVVLMDSVSVGSPDEISAPEGFAKAWGSALAHGGTVSVYLTVDGYVLKASPTVSDVHVDSIMDDEDDVRKTIRERGGKFVVLSEDESREFGTYDTRDQAEARLRQIERFKKESIREGSFVSWNSSGGRARGRVEHVMQEGVLGIPDSSFKINAQPGDPAVLIRVWERGPDGWRETETLVGHKSSTLTTISSLKKSEGYSVPEAVRSAARQALKWIGEGKAGSGFTSVGRGRAQQLADGGRIGRDTLVKMRAYFARHAVDKEAEGWGDKSNPTPGMVAWYAWGGDAGRTWVNRALGDVEKASVKYRYDDPVLLESLSSDDLIEFTKVTAILDAGGDPSVTLAKQANPEPLRDYWREGGRGQIDWGSPGDSTARVAAVSNYMDDEQARGYCAIRHNEVTGMWPGDARNRAMGKAMGSLELPGGAVYRFPIVEDVVKHGDHDQKTHGRRGGSLSISPEVAQSIIERVRERGGLSVSMVDGSEPPGGYMVAIVEGVKPAIAEASDFYDPVRGPQILSDFLNANKTQLTGGDYLGLWHDSDSGKVFLDVSQNVKDRDAAVRLGSPSERNQISIWDVVRGQEIPTGGTGEIAKSNSGNQTAGHFEDDGRRDRRLCERTVGDDEQEFVKHLPNRHDQRSHGRGVIGLAGAVGRAQRQASNLLQRMGAKKQPPRTYTREEANVLRDQYRAKHGPRMWELTGRGSDLTPRVPSFGDSPDD